MICPRCGMSIPDESKFCLSCGNQIAQRYSTYQPMDLDRPAYVPEHMNYMPNNDMPKYSGYSTIDYDSQPAGSDSNSPYTNSRFGGGDQPRFTENRKSFPSLYEANLWLSKRDNVRVIEFSVSTSSSLGMFANHAKVRSVSILYFEYHQSTGYCYGFDEVEVTSALKGTNAEKHIERWKKKYPACEVVSAKSKSNARGSASSLAFGIGLDRVEHCSIYILYRCRNV